mmetsp:Transcript_221/g.588  ORF Transcript_221/g.588 Transcript_221/m.588 type:complete len:232 (-) Transcript_221:347-1042(-)
MQVVGGGRCTQPPTVVQVRELDAVPLGEVGVEAVNQIVMTTEQSRRSTDDGLRIDLSVLEIDHQLNKLVMDCGTVRELLLYPFDVSEAISQARSVIFLLLLSFLSRRWLVIVIVMITDRSRSVRSDSFLTERDVIPLPLAANIQQGPQAGRVEHFLDPLRQLVAGRTRGRGGGNEYAQIGRQANTAFGQVRKDEGGGGCGIILLYVVCLFVCLFVCVCLDWLLRRESLLCR